MHKGVAVHSSLPVPLTVRLLASRRSRLLIAALVAGPVVLFGTLTLGLAAATSSSSDASSGGCAADPAHPAIADIPTQLQGDSTGADQDGVSPLAAYQDACERWGVDWAILAGIGKKECDHGRSRRPGCHPPGTTNPAGARGYMQFLGSTWRRGLGQRELEPRTSPPAPDGQGYATDGDNDGDADPWSWPDATHSAARYLIDLGVHDDPEAAVFGYNPSRTYVADVLALAATYRAASTDTGVPVELAGTPGDVPLRTMEGITVHAGIAPQVEDLVAAAQAVGFELAGGGYRSPAEQIALRRQNCGTSDFAIFEMPSSQCSPPTAQPGS
ncbi:MAG: hypothetical protein ACRDQW_04635, partial [Haloechinothrix sp.]